MRPNKVVACESCGEDDPTKLAIVMCYGEHTGKLRCLECAWRERNEDKSKRRRTDVSRTRIGKS